MLFKIHNPSRAVVLLNNT